MPRFSIREVAVPLTDEEQFDSVKSRFYSSIRNQPPCIGLQSLGNFWLQRLPLHLAGEEEYSQRYTEAGEAANSDIATFSNFAYAFESLRFLNRRLHRDSLANIPLQEFPANTQLLDPAIVSTTRSTFDSQNPNPPVASRRLVSTILSQPTQITSVQDLLIRAHNQLLTKTRPPEDVAPVYDFLIEILMNNAKSDLHLTQDPNSFPITWEESFLLLMANSVPAKLHKVDELAHSQYSVTNGKNLIGDQVEAAANMQSTLGHHLATSFLDYRHPSHEIAVKTITELVNRITLTRWQGITARVQDPAEQLELFYQSRSTLVLATAACLGIGAATSSPDQRDRSGSLLEILVPLHEADHEIPQGNQLLFSSRELIEQLHKATLTTGNIEQTSLASVNMLYPKLLPPQYVGLNLPQTEREYDLNYWDFMGEIHLTEQRLTQQGDSLQRIHELTEDQVLNLNIGLGFAEPRVIKALYKLEGSEFVYRLYLRDEDFKYPREHIGEMIPQDDPLEATRVLSEPGIRLVTVRMNLNNFSAAQLMYSSVLSDIHGAPAEATAGAYYFLNDAAQAILMVARGEKVEGLHSTIVEEQENSELLERSTIIYDPEDLSIWTQDVIHLKNLFERRFEFFLQHSARVVEESALELAAKPAVIKLHNQSLAAPGKVLYRGRLGRHHRVIFELDTETSRMRVLEILTKNGFTRKYPTR